jgi:hypothetical protein
MTQEYPTPKNSSNGQAQMLPCAGVLMMADVARKQMK